MPSKTITVVPVLEIERIFRAGPLHSLERLIREAKAATPEKYRNKLRYLIGTRLDEPYLMICYDAWKPTKKKRWISDQEMFDKNLSRYDRS